MPQVSRHWTDDPIIAGDQDSFGRLAYAQRAADLIAASHSWESSVVFGLTGPWGSGKSSLIAMIEERLRERFDDWRIAKFTPWATNDTGGLLSEFYSSLSDALPDGSGQASFRRLAGRLVKLAAPAATLIPVAGNAVAGAAAEAVDWLWGQQPWDRTFARAAAELHKAKVRVLVVADDIDRLQADELGTLLKVVRLLGRFPGVQYLLAYDEETIFRTLGASTVVSKDARAAQRFMEKIVQYPLVVPPLLKQQQISQLDDGINAALSVTGRRATESSRLSQALEVFLSQLTTPRAIGRFTAQLRHHLPMVPSDEINDDDVVLLTLLRVAFPSVYGQVPAWRETLLNGHSGKLKPGRQGVEYEPADLTSLVRDVPGDDRPAAIKLLTLLFPNLDERRFSSGTRGGRRICDDAYFDRYFAMGIPEHDIADQIVFEAVARACIGQPAELRGLLVGVDSPRAVLVLRKATQGALPDGDTAKLGLISSLASMLTELDDSAATWLRPRDRARGFIASIVESLSSNEEPERILQALAAASGDDRFRIWMTIKDPAKAWYETVSRALAIQARHVFLANVAARDEARFDDGSTTGLSLLLTLGAQDEFAELRRDLEAGLERGEFLLEDVAARLINSHLTLGLPGAEWEMAEVDQQQWNQLGLGHEDAWYSLDRIDDIDFHDRRWENRRRFVRGRVQPPPPPAPVA